MDRLEVTRPLRFGDDSWDSPNTLDTPLRSRFLPTTRRNYPSFTSATRKGWENNLKLDTKSGEIPSRVFIKSKRDSEDENVILPTVDLTFNPFNTPDEHLPQVTPPSLEQGS
jgi:hypothetical protein